MSFSAPGFNHASTPLHVLETIAFRADTLGAAELERARRLLANGAPVEHVLDQLARRLTNKFLHRPTQALNQAGEPERTELLSVLHRIYQLPEAH
jgi:glutamyl-tRNA reductase